MGALHAGPDERGNPDRTLVYGGTGCNDDAYPSELPAAWIAVVDGGTTACSYLQRVQVAEALGAAAVVVAHNAEGNPPVLAGSMVDFPVGIPAVAVSQADGAAIKAIIEAGPAPQGSVHKRAEHPGIRDGDVENGIIIHEYGHGVSNRLTARRPRTASAATSRRARAGATTWRSRCCSTRGSTTRRASAAWARTRCSSPTAPATASARARTRAT